MPGGLVGLSPFAVFLAVAIAGVSCLLACIVSGEIARHFGGGGGARFRRARIASLAATAFGGFGAAAVNYGFGFAAAAGAGFIAAILFASLQTAFQRLAGPGRAGR